MISCGNDELQMKKRGTLARGYVIDGTYEVLFYE
jgi:hypothetical protein